MNRIVSVLLVVLIVAPALGQHRALRASDPAQAREILLKAQAAAAELRSVVYDGMVLGEGPQAAYMPLLEARVQAKRSSDPRQPKIRIDGSHTPPSTGPSPSETSGFKFASDGEQAAHMSEKFRIFATGKAEHALTVERINLFPDRFLSETAYGDALNGAVLTHEGTASVEGVECDVVKVDYAAAGRPQPPAWERFFIAKNDLLLRRYEIPLSRTRMRARGEKESSIIFTVDKLTANPDLSDEIFALSAPQGYAMQLFQPVRRQLESAQEQPQPLPRRQAAAAVGSQAPDWTLRDSSGEQVSLKSLRGQVVVLDFWATWCGPCKMAMPGLQKLHEQFKDKPVKVFGVNCLERNPNANPMAYIKQRGYTYGQLLEGTSVANAYGVRGIPAFFVIDREGKILYQGAGYDPSLEKKLAEIISSALEPAPTAASS